ncbi:MAG: PAS domain-containing protein, partial [Halieaceae bacterium]|nr:PAS domain-containing protein [Halieaceae bacterium]
MDVKTSSRGSAIGSHLVAAPGAQAEWLQPVLDAMPIPVFIKDTAGAYTAVNTPFLELLGQPREKVVKSGVYEIAAHHQAVIFHQHDLILMREGGSQVYDSHLEAADGTERSITLYKNAIMDADGNCLGIIGAVIDQTERNQLIQEYQQASWLVGERVKELRCVAQASETIVMHGHDPELVLRGIADAIPPSFQYPDITVARVSIGDFVAATASVDESPWQLVAPVVSDGVTIGEIKVGLSSDPGQQAIVRLDQENVAFLPEEQGLLEALAQSLGTYYSGWRAARSARSARDRLERAEAQARIGHWDFNLTNDERVVSETFRQLIGLAHD